MSGILVDYDREESKDCKWLSSQEVHDETEDEAKEDSCIGDTQFCGIGFPE